jgi:hypothetical protein
MSGRKNCAQNSHTPISHGDSRSILLPKVRFGLMGRPEGAGAFMPLNAAAQRAAFRPGPSFALGAVN